MIKEKIKAHLSPDKINQLIDQASSYYLYVDAQKLIHLIEKEIMNAALDAADKNKVIASDLLNMNRSTFAEKFKRIMGDI